MAYWDIKQIYFKDYDDFAEKFNDFIDWTKQEDQLATMQAFAYWINAPTGKIRDCKDRDDLKSLRAFSKIKDEEELEKCYVTIDKISRGVENVLSQKLLTSRNQVGAIFLLKNDFGYQDKQEVQQTVKSYTIDLADDE